MNRAVSRRRLLCGGVGAAAGLSASVTKASAPAAEWRVFICLRGGADALSLLVPYRETVYYRARPRLAIAMPGAPGRAVALDPHFALHPALASLKPWFERGELGAVVGVGFAKRMRSHGDAQRALDQAIAAALGEQALERPTGTLQTELLRVAERIRSAELPRAVLLESHGWDTHVAQGCADSGRLAPLLAELRAALVAFHARVGAQLKRVRVIVLSEFGRSLYETRLAGTDDGGASLLFALGGPEPLGRVVGSYGSLAACWDERRGAHSVDAHTAPTLELSSVLEQLLAGQGLRG